MDEYTPEPDEPDHYPDDGPDAGADDVAEPPHRVNWNLLSADDLEVERVGKLQRLAAWLRRTWPTTPPAWCLRSGHCQPRAGVGAVGSASALAGRL